MSGHRQSRIAEVSHVGDSSGLRDLDGERRPFGLWTLLALMKRIHFEDYFKLSAEVENLAHVAQEIRGGQFPAPAGIRQTTIAMIDGELTAHCRRLGLTQPIYALQRLRQELTGRPELTMLEVSLYLQDFRNRIEDGLRDMVYQQIDPCDVEIFEKPVAADDPVALRFLGTTWDLEEAGSCLATGRFTACVFHLSRAMEVALRTLGAALGIDTPNPSWDAILGKGDKMIALKVNERPEWWTANATFYAEAIKDLRAVRDAWRNPTMHVEKKYTQGHARDIYAAVGALLRHLATTLAEPPAP